MPSETPNQEFTPAEQQLITRTLKKTHTQAFRVYEEVFKTGSLGATWDEVAIRVGKGHSSISTRFSQLWNRGHGCIQKTKVRRRTRDGGTAAVYTAKPMEEFFKLMTKGKQNHVLDDAQLLKAVRSFQARWRGGSIKQRQRATAALVQQIVAAIPPV
jgi:predicted transcriptional regulator